MKQSQEEILADLPKKPHRSRLDPYLELIQELRTRKWTFQQIADLLAEKADVKVTGSAVHDFLKRRSRPSYPREADRSPRVRSERPTAGGGPPSFNANEFEFSTDEPLRIASKSSDRKAAP
jgi:transposase